MKKVFTAFILVFLQPGLQLYAEEIADLQVVYEKNFDEPIADVILAELEVTSKEAWENGWKEVAFTKKRTTDDKVSIFYPKVVIISRKESIEYPGEPVGEMRAEEIRFYDENGKQKKSLSAGHRLLRSENGRYLVTVDPFGDGYDAEGNHISHQGGGVIYNWNGDEIGRIASGRLSQVSDNGYVLAGWTVYDSLGSKVGNLKLDLSGEYLSAEVNCSKMDQSGEYIVTVLSMFGPKKALYVLWDKTGRILWKKEFSFEVTGSMPLSHSLIKDVGIVGKAWTYIIMIDWDGNLLWNVEEPVGGNYRSKFSYDNNTVFMISSSGCIICFRAISGEISWRHKADWPRMTIARNYPDRNYYYDRLILLKDDAIIVARTLVDYGGIASGVVLVDANSGDLLLEPTQYQNVSNMTSCDNILFIVEKHKLTGAILAWR